MTTPLILFGAGTTGRVIARHLREQGKSFIFADNDPQKQYTKMEGVEVVSPSVARLDFPRARWICAAMQPVFREQIMDDMERMGVEVLSTWDFLDRRTSLPSVKTWNALMRLAGDRQTSDFLWDQYEFRTHGSKHAQIAPSPASEIYFAPFIRHSNKEHYVDCGAADGDTVEAFLKSHHRSGYEQITAFEPDRENYDKFQSKHFPSGVRVIHGAVSDFDGEMSFTSYGDYSSHLGGHGEKVPVHKLDSVIDSPPTFIKMDIEGSELEALWGARDLIRQHSPVLAVCAYHSADHLWRIPLLIHALNPDYRIFLRRYAEETWELCWYAVPESRLA